MKIKRNVAISESGFIFNPATGESYSINPIGIEIFNMIRDQKKFEEISATILQHYSTDKDTFEKDYTDFLGFLKQYHLVETDEEKEN